MTYASHACISVTKMAESETAKNWVGPLQLANPHTDEFPSFEGVINRGSFKNNNNNNV